jgi:hypothetical protein
MRATTNKVLGVVVVLQGLILSGQWLGGPTLVTPAAAQVFDPGRERAALLEEIKLTNTKLDKMIGILQGGELQVRTVSPDETNAKPRGR